MSDLLPTPVERYLHGNRNAYWQNVPATERAKIARTAGKARRSAERQRQGVRMSDALMREAVKPRAERSASDTLSRYRSLCQCREGEPRCLRCECVVQAFATVMDAKTRRFYGIARSEYKLAQERSDMGEELRRKSWKRWQLRHGYTPIPYVRATRRKESC